jgi:hypothetical protein
VRGTGLRYNGRAIAASAQTERRGLTRPVRDLLGGETSPAALFSNPIRAARSPSPHDRRMYDPRMEPVWATVKESR